MIFSLSEFLSFLIFLSHKNIKTTQEYKEKRHKRLFLFRRCSLCSSTQENKEPSRENRAAELQETERDKEILSVDISSEESFGAHT
jgi:hypothetical protein